MSRDSLLNSITRELEKYTKWKAIVDQIQLKQIYEVSSGYDSFDNTTGLWVTNLTHTYLCRAKVFNLESIRFEVLASSTSEIGGWRCSEDKKHWETIGLHRIKSVKPVAKEDLPLYMGMEFSSPSFAKVLTDQK